MSATGLKRSPVIARSAPRVQGGNLVDKPGSAFDGSRKSRIVIGPHAVVTGTLGFRRWVDLYVSATILNVVGAKAMPFSDATP